MDHSILTRIEWPDESVEVTMVDYIHELLVDVVDEL